MKGTSAWRGGRKSSAVRRGEREQPPNTKPTILGKNKQKKTVAQKEGRGFEEGGEKNQEKINHTCDIETLGAKGHIRGGKAKKGRGDLWDTTEVSSSLESISGKRGRILKEKVKKNGH